MLNPRLSAILDYVEKNNFASIEKLSEITNVSTQTIRRDVKALADKNLVDRYHGGASKRTSASSGIPNVAYSIRQEHRREEKEKVAELVAQHIENGSSLFLSIGTTMEAIARALRFKKDLTVFTNSIKVANILHEETNFVITVPCGRIKKRNGGLTDYDTKESIEKIRVDYFLFSGAALDKNGYLLDYHTSEVSITKAVLKRSSKAYLVMDTAKINATAPIEVLSIKDIDSVFFEEEVKEENIIKMARQGDVEIITPY